MASEAKRGCGYRKVGGLYLVGEFTGVPCDRLPYPLDVCPVCGAGIKVGRGFTEINPLRLFGPHDQQVPVFQGEPGLEGHVTKVICTDKFRPCFLCDPTDEPAYIMRVGEKYYPMPKDFLDEGIAQGFSKRIAQIPREFEVGKTIIYLAHINACVVREPVAVQQAMTILENRNPEQPRLVEAEQEKRVMGIFTAFIPQRIEKLYWQSELDNMSDKERESLAKRGITLVGIPNGDNDHA